MEFNDIITEIHTSGFEIEVYKYLHNYILGEYQNNMNVNSELQARITAIRKINKDKNNAIAAMCDLDN